MNPSAVPRIPWPWRIRKILAAPAASHSSQDEANPTLRQGPRRISGMVSPAVPTHFHHFPSTDPPVISGMGPCCKLRSQLDHIFAGYLRPPLLHWDLHEKTPGFSTENGGQCMWHPLRNNRMLAKISHQKVIGEKIIPLLNEKEHIYGSVSKPCTPGEHQNSW